MKHRIPGTRSTYSPVTSLGNMLTKSFFFLHFSNSVVNMLAKSLVNMMAESLVSGVISKPVSQNNDKLISQGKHEHLFNTIYQL